MSNLEAGNYQNRGIVAFGEPVHGSGPDDSAEVGSGMFTIQTVHTSKSEKYCCKNFLKWLCVTFVSRDITKSRTNS